MSDKIIVAIAREHGSGGREIGKRLSEILGISYYNKELIALTAEESGLAEEFIQQVDEKEHRLSLYDMYMNTAVPSVYTQARIAQEKVIHMIAEKESCVIIGRAAGYVLRDEPGCVRVFIHAPLKDRIARIGRTYGDNEKKAEQEIRRSDKQRSAYFRVMTGQKWDDYNMYDIVINSKCGVETTAQTIAAFVKNR